MTTTLSHNPSIGPNTRGRFIFYFQIPLDNLIPVCYHYYTMSNHKLYQGDCLEIMRYGHPPVKPLSILENLVVNSSQEGEVVLDCFMGSGSTGVATLNTNRDFIGIELDEGYFKIAKERIESVQ